MSRLVQLSRLIQLTVALSLVACQPASAPDDEVALIREAMKQLEQNTVEGENCEIVVDGYDDIIRALINTSSGVLIETTVIDGHEIHFICPAPKKRNDVDVIIERPGNELSYWEGVDVSPPASTGEQILTKENAKRGLPSDLARERLQAKWRDFVEAEPPDVGSETAGELGEAAPFEWEGPKRVQVSIRAHELTWAYIKLQYPNGYMHSFELNPSEELSLKPGSYGLKVQLKARGDWLSAGSFVVRPEAGECIVQMLAAPPKPKINCI